AVRMTIALQSRLAKDLAALDREDYWAEHTRQRERRRDLSDLVEKAAHVLVTTRREAEKGTRDEPYSAEVEIEHLSTAAYERLIDAEDGWLMGRPFDEVVAHICRDLGMTPDAAARLLTMVEAPPELPVATAALRTEASP